VSCRSCAYSFDSTTRVSGILRNTIVTSLSVITCESVFISVLSEADDVILRVFVDMHHRHFISLFFIFFVDMPLAPLSF